MTFLDLISMVQPLSVNFYALNLVGVSRHGAGYGCWLLIGCKANFEVGGRVHIEFNEKGKVKTLKNKNQYLNDICIKVNHKLTVYLSI